MPTYIILTSYTQEGIADIKESPKRLDEAKLAFQSMGAELKEFFLTMGRYDMVVVVEAPDDETVTKVLLTIGSKGSVRTETLRAFPEEEYRKIVGALR